MCNQIFAPSIAFVLLAWNAMPVIADGRNASRMVVDHALEAVGGAAKIRDIKAMSFSARFVEDETVVNVNGIIAEPLLFRLEFNTSKGHSYLVVSDGDTIWVKHGDVVTECHIGNDQSEFFSGFTTFFYGVGLPDRLLALKGDDYQLSIDGERTISGVNAVGLRVRHRHSSEAVLYFNKTTGLPVKSQLVFSEKKTIEFFFDEYKDFDGVKHFTKLTMRCGETRMDYQLRDIKFLKEIDINAFKKPK